MAVIGFSLGNVSGTQAIFELSAGPFTSNELRVVSFEGTEEISAPFSFEVVILSQDFDEMVLEAAVLGARAMLTLHDGEGGSRFVCGVIDEIELEGISPHARETRHRLRLVPRLALLSRRRNSRIFEDKRVFEIIDELLDEAGIARRW